MVGAGEQTLQPEVALYRLRRSRRGWADPAIANSDTDGLHDRTRKGVGHFVSVARNVAPPARNRYRKNAPIPREIEFARGDGARGRSVAFPGPVLSARRAGAALFFFFFLFVPVRAFVFFCSFA